MATQNNCDLFDLLMPCSVNSRAVALTFNPELDITQKYFREIETLAHKVSNEIQVEMCSNTTARLGGLSCVSIRYPNIFIWNPSRYILDKTSTIISASRFSLQEIDVHFKNFVFSYTYDPEIDDEEPDLTRRLASLPARPSAHDCSPKSKILTPDFITGHTFW